MPGWNSNLISKFIGKRKDGLGVKKCDLNDVDFHPFSPSRLAFGLDWSGTLLFPCSLDIPFNNAAVCEHEAKKSLYLKKGPRPSTFLHTWNHKDMTRGKGNYHLWFQNDMLFNFKLILDCSLIKERLVQNWCSFNHRSLPSYFQTDSKLIQSLF